MKKSDDFHRVCLLQAHVKGRPPRPAVRTGETGKPKHKFPGWIRARQWNGPAWTAAAQDANREERDGFVRPLERIFCQCSFLWKQENESFPVSTGKNRITGWITNREIRGIMNTLSMESGNTAPPMENLETEHHLGKANNRGAYPFSAYEATRKPVLKEQKASFWVQTRPDRSDFLFGGGLFCFTTVFGSAPSHLLFLFISNFHMKKLAKCKNNKASGF